MLIIFDFDGTIADSLDVFAGIINQYFKSNYTAKHIREKGTSKIIKEVKIHPVLLPLYVLVAQRKIHKFAQNLKPFPEIRQTLAALNKKHTLAIVSSNSKTNIEMFLRKHNMHKYITHTESSIHYFGKYNKINKVINRIGAKPSDAIYVGDESRDIIAAKKARVCSVAVTWGYENRSLLAKHKPDKIINNPKDLLKHANNLPH